MPQAAGPVLAYRVVASDLDGTLLNNLGRISDRTQAVVEQVRLSGTRFVIATARPLRDAIQIAKSLALTDPIICQNGAIIASTPALNNIWDTYLIPYQTLVNIVSFVRQATPAATIAVDYPLDRLTDPDWPGPYSRTVSQATLWPLSAKEFPRRRAACILARGISLESEKIQNLYDVTVTSSASGLVEISRKGVDKARALRRICKRLDIAPEPRNLIRRYA